RAGLLEIPEGDVGPVRSDACRAAGTRRDRRALHLPAAAGPEQTDRDATPATGPGLAVRPRAGPRDERAAARRAHRTRAARSLADGDHHRCLRVRAHPGPQRRTLYLAGRRRRPVLRRLDHAPACAPVAWCAPAARIAARWAPA